jgi:acyl-CoA-binding protein
MSRQLASQRTPSILLLTAAAAASVAILGVSAYYWLTTTRRQTKFRKANTPNVKTISNDEDELLQRFRQATETASGQLFNLAHHGDKLLLYGLYKQATVGDVRKDQEPSKFNVIGHAKYEAWLKFKGMPVEAAMRSYVQVVTEFSSSATTVMEYETEELDMFNAMGNKPSTLMMEHEYEDSAAVVVTPLLVQAAQSGDLQQIREALALLDKDESTVNTRDDSGQTALHFAADRGCSDIVVELLNAGADPNAADLEGIGVLQAAVIAGHAEVASILLERGADPQQPDMDGDTPLSCAQDDGSEEMKLLFASVTNTVNRET